MSEKLERRERGGEGEREGEERGGKGENTSPLAAAQARIHELELGNASSLFLSMVGDKSVVYHVGYKDYWMH